MSSVCSAPSFPALYEATGTGPLGSVASLLFPLLRTLTGQVCPIETLQEVLIHVLGFREVKTSYGQTME